MSGLGKVPSFEPDEEYKKLIEHMFTQKKEEPIEEEPEAVEEAPKRPTRRLRLPEPPKQTPKQEEQAQAFANEEMEIIREAFLEFTDKVNDTILYAYLHSEVEEFAEACEDMRTLLLNDIDESEVTSEGESDYEKFRKLRARILNDVYNHNKEGK